MLIAFCDDEPFTVDKTIQVLKEQLKAFSLTAVIKIYNNSTQMISDIIDNGINYDMYFLDIEMPKINGIDLAREIRQINPHAIILFLSSYNHFGNKVCRMSANAYLYKFDSTDMHKIDIDRAIRKYLQLISTYDFPISRTEKRTVLINDIVYIESIKRQVIVHMIDRTSFNVSNKYSLSYFEEQDEFSGFFRISRSELINFRNIKVVKNYIKMCTGEVFYPKKEVIKQIHDRFFIIVKDNIFL